MFVDAAGRQWNLRITVGAALRIKGAYGIDLVGDPGDALQKMSADVMLMLSVVREISVDHPGVDALALADSLDRDGLDALRDAVVAATVDFCPRQSRDMLRKALAKSRNAEAAMMAAAATEMDRLIDSKIAEATQMLGANSGDSQAQPESIHADTH